MNTYEQLMQLGKQINDTAKAKGFWDNPDRNKGEMVMLTVSELGECLEAHRNGKVLDKDQFLRHNIPYIEWQQTWRGTESEYNSRLKSGFEIGIKDSYQDEIADVMIRLLDYTYGWNIPVFERECRRDSMGNFGHDLLDLTLTLLIAYSHTDRFYMVQDRNPGKDWGYAIAAIIKFCEWYEIDLIQHMQWKMKYNSSRERLHGKAY